MSALLQAKRDAAESRLAGLRLPEGGSAWAKAARLQCWWVRMAGLRTE